MVENKEIKKESKDIKPVSEGVFESETSVKDKQDPSTVKPVSKGKGKKKKNLKFIKKGAAHILATYNNTIVTFTDVNGNTISWSSAGKCGFKGPKKATPFAASTIVEDAASRAKERGLEEIIIYVKGVGLGRDSAIRSLNVQGFTVTNIKDITPTPHNGCRKRKPRRV